LLKKNSEEPKNIQTVKNEIRVQHRGIDLTEMDGSELDGFLKLKMNLVKRKQCSSNSAIMELGADG
jgi:hypothetical protein